MKNTNKKGFTIVELVIVIAVIAILAAVLIPTFASIINKANISKDTQLIRNLNTALAAATTKPATMHDALEIAAEYGYDVEKINASATQKEIVWDSVNNLFCYYDAEAGVSYIPEYTPENATKDYQLWIVDDEVNAKFSTYLKDGATVTNPVSLGIDVGNNRNINITFATDATIEVVIRTNGGTLSVDAANATVKHYGESNTLAITAIAGNSYHEFGIVGTAVIESGRLVVETGALVAQVVVQNDAKLDVTTVGSVSQVTAGNASNITGVNTDDIVAPTEYAEDGTFDSNKKALIVNNREDFIKAITGETALTGYNRVVLGNDIAWNYDVTGFQYNVNAKTTLDLNGHNIVVTATNHGNASHGPFLVTSEEFIIMDSQGGGYIKGIANTDHNFDLFHIGNSTGGKMILESGSLLLEANGGDGNCAFTGVVDVMTNCNKNVDCTFVMEGGTIAVSENQEAIRLWNNSGRTSNVTINGGYICGTIYIMGGTAGKGEKLTINGGVIVADRPIRSSWATLAVERWGDACEITLNGGNIIATEGAFNGNSINYKGIIGTSYDHTGAAVINKWTAEKIFNITDNRK